VEGSQGGRGISGSGGGVVCAAREVADGAESQHCNRNGGSGGDTAATPMPRQTSLGSDGYSDEESMLSDNDAAAR